MTAKELIAELTTCEPDAMVALGDYEYAREVSEIITPVPEVIWLVSEDKPAPSDSILKEAARIRGGERNADYGDAVESFEKIARLANEMTGLSLTPAQCCKVMMAVKLVRESYSHKRDNLVDLCGYTDILNLIEGRNNA